MTDRQSDSRAALEAARIRAETARRGRELPADLYDPSRPGHLFLRQGQERALARALGGAGLLPLAGRRILEIGCGSGRWLELLRAFGADEERLAGVDLEPDRLATAASRLPRADLREADATALSWPDASFDVVLQATVFTSILDAQVRRQVAAEMARVLAPGGAVVWYDFRVDNPRNPHVRGVRRRELAALFPGFRLRVRRVTLAPPLARLLAPRAVWLATLIEACRILDTHDMAVLLKPSQG